MTKQIDLLQKITRAREEITTAEAELADVLNALQVSSAGEKVCISEVLTDAYSKLKDTKDSLAKLEGLLVKE